MVPAAAPLRFDPVYLTDADLEDLSTFTGMSHEACRERLRTYSMAEMADAWRRADPKNPEQIIEFYSTTDLYIWELMQWHASPARLGYWHALAELVRRWPPRDGYRRVLDFGCGVGTDALFLASQGYDVTLVDVPGLTFEFARHRFRRRSLAARFVESRVPLPEPDGTYDVVVCFDVFEHLPDPLEAARRLVAALRPAGIMLQQAAFEDDGTHPCHLNGNVQRFAGLRWHIHMAGLGLISAGSLKTYRKAVGLLAYAQRARYRVWRATGWWLSRIPRGS